MWLWLVAPTQKIASTAGARGGPAEGAAALRLPQVPWHRLKWVDGAATIIPGLARGSSRPGTA